MLRPLILTALFAPEIQTKLNQARAQFFPAERNFLDAHLTLFHALPGESLSQIKAVLSAYRERPAPDATCSKLFSLGQGFAVSIDAPKLVEVRKELASSLEALLSPQDKRSFRPHVTLQNKVTAAVAKRDYARAQATFQPMITQVVALCLWTYLGGPWELQETFLFKPTPDA